MNLPATVRIDIWSDFVCPWCWIGKHRLARALAAAGAPAATIRWHPFLLEPDAGPEPVPLRQAYAAKFGGARAAEQMLARTQATARAEGLPMDFDRGQVRVSTRDAHRLLGLAAEQEAAALARPLPGSSDQVPCKRADQGMADAISEALFRAHFEHGRNLADPQTLIAAAAAGGMDAASVRALLAGDDGLAAIGDSRRQARRLGIDSVPFFILDGRLAIRGAQPPVLFTQAFAELANADDR